MVAHVRAPDRLFGLQPDAALAVIETGRTAGGQPVLTSSIVDRIDIIAGIVIAAHGIRLRIGIILERRAITNLDRNCRTANLICRPIFTRPTPMANRRQVWLIRENARMEVEVLRELHLRDASPGCGVIGRIALREGIAGGKRAHGVNKFAVHALCIELRPNRHATGADVDKSAEILFVREFVQADAGLQREGAVVDVEATRAVRERKAR